ncbi:MAG: EAL domain-containing protein, partial [Burkholderiaceae bacterium]|nr:EAL domain-containing protein [Burkholderiaceae bacterium]
MPYSFLQPNYDVGLVILSVIVAIFASFIALDLAQRVLTTERKSASYWLVGGSFAMGTGIWSMHFVAMLAFSLPIRLGYDVPITFLSWVAAVVVSGIALYIASRPEMNWRRVIAGGLAMGAGICLMHYTGMFAMRMEPAIQWRIGWFATSVVIAVVASFAALLIFFWMRSRPLESRVRWEMAAAIVMGFAISGMHYSGMAAAEFPLGSICRAASSLNSAWLGITVGVATLSLLTVTLVTSILDARMQARTAVLARSLQKANQELQRAALYDALTQLPNRLLFEERLDRAVVRAGRAQHAVALLFVDLDGFKLINDSLGHEIGDQVLKVTSGRLLSTIRASETVARIGGDEFIVLVDAVEDRPALVNLAQRIMQSLTVPIVIAEDEMQLSASIGIAIYPDDADDQQRLVACADAAMYAAKAAGKNTYRFHDPATMASANGLMAMQRDLRHALERGEFQLYYQAKVSTQGAELLGVEALLRWQHPERGLVSPGEFIPIAERFGLIVSIGEWVIDEACKDMRRWLDLGMRVPVAVNLAVQQLRQPDLAQTIQAYITRHSVDAAMLTLEITESAAMDDAAATLAVIERLKAIGVKIAIDDFGTGYSSLSYLRRFTVDQLKIDRTFVQDIEMSEDARSIVEAVVHLAHSL